MWRLLAFILLCVFFLVFIVFNLENKTDVSFGFWTFSGIPIFLTAFSSFVLGMLFAVPFVLSFGKKRKKPSQGKQDPAGSGSDSHPSLEENRTFGLKKWWGSKNKNGPSDTDKTGKDAASPMTEVKKESSHYGVD